MDYDYLQKHNLWWKGKENIQQDFHVKKWNSKKFRWVPEIIKKINQESGSIHIISGPRQVGKTTAMKLLIKKLLEKGTAIENIFYVRCDEVSTVEELREAFETYETFKETKGLRFIFLDEITNVENWHGFIKNMYDNGEVEDSILFLTGSNAISIRKGAEYLPGRRGKGRDFIMLPLSFRSFLEVTQPKVAREIEKIKQLSINELRNKTKKAYRYKQELDRAFQKYLQCGGFPLPLEEFLEKETISHDINDVYLSWFVGDVFKNGKSDIIAKQIIKVLLEKMSSCISWEKISKEIEIKSPKTVASYIELFQNLYVLSMLYHVDPDKQIANFAKNKKTHFMDPFIYRLFEHWCLLENKNKEEILVESIAAIALMRFSFKQSGLEKRINENCFYWKNGYEIDVVVNNHGQLFGFEVKWGKVRNVSKKIGKIKNIIYITKNEVSFDEPIKLPLSVFLAILSE